MVLRDLWASSFCGFIINNTITKEKKRKQKEQNKSKSKTIENKNKCIHKAAINQ